ncbi:MAG: leucyl aminopeptidase [Shimia sp.]
MTPILAFSFTHADLDSIAPSVGDIAVLVEGPGKFDQLARRANRLTKGALERFVESEAFDELKPGQARALAFPSGMEAERLIVAKLPKRPDASTARKAGAALAKAKGKGPLLVLGGANPKLAEVAEGIALRAYSYGEHKSEAPTEPGAVTVMCSKPDEVEEAARPALAVAEGVFFTRDLVSAPSNHLTTTAFAEELEALRDTGLEVRVMEEDELEKLGMRLLLAVGQGSVSPSKVVVMEWKGAEGPPLALIGKGVVFDTGGISLKPAGGMEDMTMDMGGAGVVSGVMKALALRKAEAHVVGLVGLVENMPDGNAIRPGDVVASMKGDTVEIINTDAEGRLVLADVLWYAQATFKPRGMIDLATLTGAIIIGLGHDKAGVFSNDDALCDAFLKAAARMEEGAWRLPLDPAYDKLLKSDIADMKNVGGRAAGSITAAQFLQRFVPEDMPWIHLDIAGVASVKSETGMAPKGATGWGVRALDALVRDMFEV